MGCNDGRYPYRPEISTPTGQLNNQPIVIKMYRVHSALKCILEPQPRVYYLSQAIVHARFRSQRKG
jgi:hypothetical protein